MKEKVLKSLLRFVIGWLARNPVMLMWAGREIVKKMAPSDAVSLTLSIRDKIRGRI